MKRRCPICGADALQRKSRKQTFRYKGESFKYEQPGEWCEKCGEAVLTDFDLKAVELRLYDFRAKVDGYLSTGEIRRIRSKLGLSQKSAAELFGGGHNAFSRYERGLARQPKAADKLLRLLDRHPALLAEIQTIRDKTAA
jgi:HTH-type transcriptional regulator / antitoxin MqsA